MSYHAVIFDLRGTLLQESKPSTTLNATVAQAQALNVDPIHFASCWFHHAHQTPRHIDLPWIESNLQAVCDDLGVTLDPLLRRRLAEQREQLLRQTLRPRRMAVKTLTRLRAAGIRTAAIGDLPPDVRLMFEQTDIVDHLDLELLSTSGTCRHNDPRVLRHTIDALGLPAKACLYVTAGGCDELEAAEGMGLVPVAFRAEDEASLEDGQSCRVPNYDAPFACVSTMVEVYWLATERDEPTDYWIDSGWIGSTRAGSASDSDSRSGSGLAESGTIG